MSQFQLFSEEEIDSLRTGGKILRDCLTLVSGLVQPGIKTIDLDRKAEEFIRSFAGAVPGFKGYHGYPATLCTSVNDACVHGIPGDYALREGDIISLDCGVLYDVLYTDACVTVPVGTVSAQATLLIRTTEDALKAAVDIIRKGRNVGDLSAAIEKTARAKGFSPVRFLTGHGLGTALHQFPDIPNSGAAGTGPVLPERTIIAVEPIICAGTGAIREMGGGWTILTSDHTLCAHAEHTLLILPDGCDILA
ncbi:MAG: type I methionyl aminopeptidase [Candidatus Peregrinibacteria bacterium]